MSRRLWQRVFRPTLFPVYRPSGSGQFWNVAIARFQHEEAMRQELADTRSELQELSTELKDRKVIDRAKALLMERQKLSEPEAYARLRKAAMDKNLKLVEVAQRMLDVADLLG